MTAYRLSLALALLAAGGIPIASADIKVSQVPLAKAASQPVAPNLLFILDDSGSMGWDYTPDYVNDNLCKRDASTTNLTACLIGHPPYMSAGFNKQYYDPRIRYAPGIKANGDSYPEMSASFTTNWTSVMDDGYKSSSAKSNLASQYTNRKWCKYNSSDCVANTTYAYPNGTYYTSGGSNTSSYTEDNVPPYYFNLQPIYCTTSDATNCSKTKTGSYQVEVPFRWCKSGSFTDCKAKKDSTYAIPSFIENETGVAAILKLTLGGWTSKNVQQSVSSIKVNGQELLSGTANYTSTSTNSTTNCTGLAAQIVAKISASAQFTATSSSCVVTLTAKTVGTWGNYAPSAVASVTTSGSIQTNGVDGFAFFKRVDIVSTTPKYQVNGSKPVGRSDCTTYTDGCSYTEEMTNFANWYAYYSTRIKSMKSAATQAFKNIDNSFRVGYTQINSLSGSYVTIKGFDTTQRSTWYTKLLGANASGSTPLREALSFAGRVFAGKKPSGISDDPMQYSCQQNFALLTTDGYWNGPNGDTSGTGVVDLAGSKIGNLDGGTTSRPYYEGPTTSSTSLADTAMYFYNNDLRTPTLGNCTSPSTGADVCENNVPISSDDPNEKQHMSTFTLGLGIDGQLTYRKDYKTALTGDFAQIKNNTLNWPQPKADSDTAVDDLWHAAVNGRGQYFSAQDPSVLVSSLKEALANISAQYGAGAAAATSTMEPVNGDNYAYVATYTTGKWVGNLESRLIDLASGNVNLQAQWCAENIPADPVKNLTACTGTLASKVAADSDTRKIYFNAAGTLTDFTKGNLGSRISNFDVTKLVQYPTWTTEYKAEANAEKLVNYLRGQWGYDNRDSNAFRFFRQRDSVLGDFVDSAPKYVCKASAYYEDPGYPGFSAGLGSGASCARTPAIYIGGNDGMLHAFNGSTGEEMWAFIPTPALTEMWRLADSTYGNNHRFFVDGTVTVGDVCISGCGGEGAVWKTILVAGLGPGVVQGSDPTTGAPLSGYFAMDVTEPSSPKLLWELTSATPGLGNKIGFAFGKPWLGKVNDAGGTPRWAVMMSSGVKPASQAASLIVVDAYSGSLVRSIDINGGVGFSRFSPKFTKPGIDQTATLVYGGDLDGNVWRIDPNSGDVAKVMSGTGQPFTTAPELTTCNGKTSVYIGSGKFIEAGDLTDKTPQTFYGFVDDYDNQGTLTSPRGSLQALSAGGATVSATSDSGSTRGWYLDLPDSPANGGAERVVMVDPKLEGNLLTFPTNIPESGVCLASGRSKLYQLPLGSCSVSAPFPPILNGSVRNLGNKLIVGMTSIKLPDGKIKLIVTGSDGQISSTSSGEQFSPTPFFGRRVTWREILRD